MYVYATCNLDKAITSQASVFDCSDLSQDSSSGVYSLMTDDVSHPLNGKRVYCDMDTAGGGYD